MAAAVHMAGLQPWDVTMSDLLAGRISLDSFQGVCLRCVALHETAAAAWQPQQGLCPVGRARSVALFLVLPFERPVLH